ncbi:DLW-39 family protein [Acaricomes phytoseiuli]|nr:DLW-39 family protein [Acaricomes phytoseiuli]MCW1248667.1 DLW-39 family protein [Acaricomes phytoseiuli]
MKKLIAIAAAVAGVIFLRKKMQESNSQKDAWSKGTDPVK